MRARVSIDSALLNKIAGSPIPLEEATPSLKLAVYHKGQRRAHLSLGEDFDLYDWASLTKIVFTVPLYMRAVEELGLDLNSPIGEFLFWWPDQSTSFRDLLTHSAGLAAWQDFYRHLQGPMEPKERFEGLKLLLMAEGERHRKPLQPKALYSDLDFFLLGAALEELFFRDLLVLWEGLQQRLGLWQTHFQVKNRSLRNKDLYAPTEKCPWRGRTLQGEVHDENAWALGGVAPHAGLFGPLSDLERFGLLLRESYLSPRGSSLSSQGTFRQFVKRATPRTQGDWALGFMLPTPGRASCGRHFSLQSFGHTGFTGTSVWYDPTKDLLVVMLSNRVHPSRENRKFVALRPLIHDWICESL